MLEVIETLRDFPDYTVSNYGYICNDRGRRIAMSPVQNGDLTVGLQYEGRQHRRSVKVLVANAFVQGKSEVFNTPMLLDGDKTNLRADNIVWRPRWYAYQFTIQFKDEQDWWGIGPVIDDQGGFYETIIDASMATGTLVREIRLGLFNRNRVFPTGKVFRFA